MTMSFDTTKANLWKPFFSRSFSHPGLSSVQASARHSHQIWRFCSVCILVILTFSFCMSWSSAGAAGVSARRQGRRGRAAGQARPSFTSEGFTIRTRGPPLTFDPHKTSPKNLQRLEKGKKPSGEQHRRTDRSTIDVT